MVKVFEQEIIGINGIRGTIYFIPADKEKGYSCAYELFVPENCKLDTTLLVHACNTGKPCITLEEANKDARDKALKDGLTLTISSDLNMPVLSPCFPRLKNYYTQQLSSEVYKNDLSNINNRIDEEKLSDVEIENIQEQCKDLPEQLCKMLESSKDIFKSLGITIDDKVIIEGYSAGSKFAGGFTALYPELIKACILGGTTGCEILPTSEYMGETINYPIGVADIPNFDFETYKSIPQFHYIGEEDNVDPADTILDEFGNLKPKYSDTYTIKEIEQIHRIKGKNVLDRYNKTEKIYKELGVQNFEFKRYPGNHQTVFENKDMNDNFIVINDIKQFIGSVLSDKMNSQKSIERKEKYKKNGDIMIEEQINQYLKKLQKGEVSEKFLQDYINTNSVYEYIYMFCETIPSNDNFMLNNNYVNKTIIPIDKIIQVTRDILKEISPELLEKFSTYINNVVVLEKGNTNYSKSRHIYYEESIEDIFIVIHEFFHYCSNPTKNNKNRIKSSKIIEEANSICSEEVVRHILKEKIVNLNDYGINIKDNELDFFRYKRLFSERYLCDRYIFLYNFNRLLEQSKKQDIDLDIEKIDEYFNCFSKDSLEYSSYEKNRDNILNFIEQEDFFDSTYYTRYVHPFSYLVSLELLKTIDFKNNDFNNLVYISNKIQRSEGIEFFTFNLLKEGEINEEVRNNLMEKYNQYLLYNQNTRKETLIDLYRKKKLIVQKNIRKVKSAELDKGKTLGYSDENNDGFINVLAIALISLLIGILIYVNL